MRRAVLTAVLGLPMSACPGSERPTASAEGSTSADPTDSADTTAGSTTGGEAPWLEVGWGVSEFNAFEGVLPLVVGPQGLAMFSVPQRGAGFYSPPDPSFDNPDMPMLQAWVDVPGYALTPDGHLNEVTDFPALFYDADSPDEPGVLYGTAVWLILPDQLEPAELAGLDAHLHVELLDAHGLQLTADHDLVIGEAPEGSPGS
ncbi:MAG: hypothetical protein KDK70_03035 [Myxococcales bacterium]|nr:hypothetical protein [Myxococcales bacterium]